MSKKPKRKAKQPKTAVKDATHLRLRLRDKLLEDLQLAADRSERTLTNEITRRLEQSLVQEDFIDTLNRFMGLVVGEFELAKKEMSEHAPDVVKKGQAVARVFAMLARRLWPECTWVKVGAGIKPDDAPTFTAPTISVTTITQGTSK